MAWGSNLFGQCNVAAGNDFVAIEAGAEFGLALRTDGSLAAWGHKSQGQCNVPSGNDFVKIAAGGWHGLAIRSDGSLVAWGRNDDGECDVPAGNDFVDVRAGDWHSAALKSDGVVLAWGDNSRGQCEVPVGYGFTTIECGSHHNLGLITCTVYVDADANGANNGSSWRDAYNYLQDGLAAASSGDEVWVAEGVYRPDGDRDHPDGTGERTASFQLKNGVAVSGGYAGFGEPDPNARDVEGHETTLSGDLNEDDANHNNAIDLLTDPCRGDNSYHVATGSGADEAGVLDGVTITGGNANGLWKEGKDRGGGLYGWTGLTVNCTITGNVATNGGGVADCNGPIKNCAILGNAARNLAGGLLDCEGPVRECTIAKNVAGRDTGGMCRCAGPIINCIISDNAALEEDTGGFGLCGPMINCVIGGNSAGRDAGAMGMGFGPVINCTISGNRAGRDGGALRRFDGLITSCTITGNLAGRRGGAIHKCRGLISNCIIYDNWSGDYPVLSDSSVPSYSCVQEDCNGAGCVVADPRFIKPGCWADVSDANAVVEPNDPNARWLEGDYRLLPSSPCIDAGDNNSVPADTADLDGDGNTAEPIPWDLDENPRIADGNNDGNSVVDMGAYEADYLAVTMRFTPQALNPESKGKWVKAHLVLPEGYTVEDVDTNCPAKIIEPFEPDIESEYMNVFINDADLVEIEAAFDRRQLCVAGIDGETLEVTVVGLFTTGQKFYGTETIKITKNYLKYLVDLAYYWLAADCGKPDWCGGVDLDGNSRVDFVDFALFDGCCIEVVAN
jgi:hypothetical protein